VVALRDLQVADYCIRVGSDLLDLREAGDIGGRHPLDTLPQKPIRAY
jgi:hypothetical protein